MTSDHHENNLLMTVFEALNSADDGDGMKALLKIVLNAVMKIERDEALKASPYERSDERIEIAEAMRGIFNSPSIETAELMIKTVISTYSKSAPEFAN